MATPSFFFYDLETSGLDPRRQRIMQFAGQRTDMDLNPIDEPVNMYVTLTDDVLPDPDAIVLTGITPQKTVAEGYSEVDFARIFMEEICRPQTIVTGYNNVRFDDEFMRYTLYRNFFDPYEWAWADSRSRWDLLDVVRMTRALRPDDIKWPVDAKGTPTNRLELITKINSLDHENAHDALNDVLALIVVAKLIKTKQPKLFDYLLNMRHKKSVAELVNLENPQPFVYSSGRYESAYEKTTVAFPLTTGTKPGSVIVYDLRYDPRRFATAAPAALASVLFADQTRRKATDFVPLPVKELSYNRCPAVAPMGVLDATSLSRLRLSLPEIAANQKALLGLKDFGDRVREAYEMREAYNPTSDVDGQLYDGFFNERDKGAIATVRAADGPALADFHPEFVDERLGKLLLRHKARNYPTILTADERLAWERYRHQRLHADLPGFSQALTRLSQAATSEGQQFILSELQLWAESIVPYEEPTSE